LHDFHSWSVPALFEELKFDLRHLIDIERIAIVGEKRWEKVLGSLAKPLTFAKIRYHTIESYRQIPITDSFSRIPRPIGCAEKRLNSLIRNRS